MPIKRTATKAPAKKATTKRAAKKVITKRVTQKATTKRAVKKTAAKKTPTKKATTKRAVKKTAAKKVPTKKVTIKRAVKKVAVKRKVAAPKPTVGFVGVGRMGANMARHLHACGYTISALYDINSDAAATLADELSSNAVKKLSAVTAASDIVITVVTDDAAMQRIYRSKKDSLLQGAAGTLFINCATLSPQVHVDIEAKAAAVGASTLEGCMASSIPQARSGTLYLMIGGQAVVFNKAKPLLNALSQDLTYVGESGSASKVKALVNMVMNINTAALAEGLGLGEALGLDLKMLCKVFAQTGANSRVLETDAADMLNRDHECYFSAAHAAKDSGIALELAKTKKLKLPLAKATKAQYELLKAAGLGELDKSAVAELTFPGRSPKPTKQSQKKAKAAKTSSKKSKQRSKSSKKPKASKKK
ncbi:MULTISPECIES: NAD(P)-dependent oxidoreductase [unclassified Lentimonas]|uniref:NAD(P)-dependent oxidoreductase n=1 Tax=unclassified Lentimonas TaxID=2630993 RepID=UPI001328E683|nr:2-hydroxy-3-oxopropionate reductase (EC [Lentimonas sp. CC19]CAA6694542.1 2-hydroxy-3-oxopropionate reductase (EC [Lentimonas sp. CC10]CAA7072084.1 2-hydroxy-3-oxopropionate reductase (EC [Lentimonas sp. CC11]